MTLPNNLYLYTSKNKSSDTIRKFLADNEIPYKELFYLDESQHEKVFSALRTWWSDGSFNKVKDFPFIIYDNEGTEQKSFVAGLRNIQSFFKPTTTEFPTT